MAKPTQEESHDRRPYPPLQFIESHQLMPYIGLIPANEVKEWLISQILNDTGSLHNPDHAHLIDTDIQFMWASSAFEKKGRYVLGQAEEVAMRAGGWQKARMEQQMHEWFGEVPKFIITLAADYCSQCSDLEFCALVEPHCPGYRRIRSAEIQQRRPAGAEAARPRC
ncbi:Uncharacterised protein [Serratia grimesii]|nr:Uncharacterised protein [Serratia grimesii]CAI2444519.1 Uncharacterised protein [Serratia grimesii]SUI32687.1 Uncharacterised protein [Serratia grimesii]